MTNNISSLFAESLNELDLTEKQKAVLRASLTLFSEKGFENTTTGDIARMAGVGEGTVYKQFKTKEQLLKTIITPAIEQVIPKVVNEFVDTVTGEEKLSFAEFLHDVVQNRLEFASDNLPQLRIFAREILINPKVKSQLKNEIHELLKGKLKQSLEYYQQQGQVVAWPASRIFRYFAGTFASYVFPAILDSDREINVVQVSHEATEFLLKGLAPKK